MQNSIENFVLWSKSVYIPAGRNKGGLVATLTSIRIFNFYDIKTLRFEFHHDICTALASKCQDFKHRGLQFHFIKQLKNGHRKFKVLPVKIFWPNLNHRLFMSIIKIKYRKADGSGNPPFFIPALWNKGILLHKTKFSILFCTRL